MLETLTVGRSKRVSERARLLVVEEGSSVSLDLPSVGVLVIGRSPEADLVLTDHAASRRHAEIRTHAGHVIVHDLGSHNGTRVNGEPLTGSRALVANDVIAIGEVVMVIYGGADEPPVRAVLDVAQLRRRLGDEVERAIEFERPLGVIVAVGIRLETIAEHLRGIDIVGRLSPATLAIVLPELDPAATGELAARIAEQTSARCGWTVCPGDGGDSNALLAAARAAADTAEQGTARSAASTVTTIEMDGRIVLLADPAMLRVYELLKRLAVSALSVLVTGETGSGKENAAYAIHHYSPRAGQPFMTLNCAALQDTLVESELFGYEKGAFTGAVGTKLGLLEAASGGTVFLDEVGELSLNAQAKLLRALETRRVTRLGSVKEREIEIRVVAATNRKLADEIKAGRFREDLYFRLAGAAVALPPLRARPREIAVIARALLERARPAAQLSAASTAALASYPWPGNVRELRNAIEFAAATASERLVEPWHLPETVTGQPSSKAEPAARKLRPIGEELAELERTRMTEALELAGGIQRRAAELISMPLRTFVHKLRVRPQAVARNDNRPPGWVGECRTEGQEGSRRRTRLETG